MYAVGGNSDLFNNNLETAGMAKVMAALTPLQDIECLINQEYTIRYKHDEEEHEVSGWLSAMGQGHAISVLARAIGIQVVTKGVAPNLARWDYHATHVNQLLLLATIDSDPIITQTAERWKGYMFGKRAKHN
ncbi:hypothetical protein EVAR_71455_1 [Eumeta japonica]|uniref:D-glucuronyl C5-epimerase C-terminal domain-containing protein n=1 Tax=Eumeta variegata TaxID=151549 RepID=A0A4C2A8X2_EUMVA|nr:hypothetical protein EVAR_71455_1 [Eumeta japonica]